MRIVVASPAFRQSESSSYDVVELLVSFGGPKHYRLFRAVNNTGIAADTVMIPNRMFVCDRDIPTWTEFTAQAAAHAAFGCVEALVKLVLNIEERYHHFIVTVSRESRHFRIFIRAPFGDIITDTPCKTIGARHHELR